MGMSAVWRNRGIPKWEFDRYFLGNRLIELKVNVLVCMLLQDYSAVPVQQDCIATNLATVGKFEYGLYLIDLEFLFPAIKVN